MGYSVRWSAAPPVGEQGRCRGTDLVTIQVRLEFRARQDLAFNPNPALSWACGPAED
jgi:hypothetical protein